MGKDAKKLDPVRWVGDPYRYLLELEQEFGSIFPLWHEENKIWFVSDLKLIKDLGKYRGLVALEPNRFLKNFVKDSAINLDESRNKEARAQLIPLINSVSSEQVSLAVTRFGKSLFTKWGSKSIPLFALMEEFSIRVMADLFFSGSPVTTASESDLLFKLLKMWKQSFSMEVLASREKEKALPPAFFLYGSALRKEIGLGLKRSENEGSLASKMKNEFGWDEERCCEELLSLLLFGHDTLAAQLSWWILNVLEAGCRSVIATEEERESSVRESMRLNPAVTHLTRSVREDLELGGHVIEKGSYLIPLIYLVNQNPRIFPDPERFQWSRFLDSSVELKTSLLSFGVQNRVCIGKGLAEKILFSSSAYLLKNWRFKKNNRVIGCSRKFLSTVSPDAHFSIEGAV